MQEAARCSLSLLPSRLVIDPTADTTLSADTQAALLLHGRFGRASQEDAKPLALGEFNQIWAALYPAEQTRIVQLLVKRVTVGEDGIAVDLRHEGLGSVLRDMMATRQTEAHA